MSLKHIDDLTLQEIAQDENLYADYESHLIQCQSCRENLEFYINMFRLLSEKPEGDFSPDFALRIISQATIIESRTKKIKSALSFLLIIILSVIPFILFPDSLMQFSILGNSFGKFFSYIRTNISEYNLNSWSLVAIIILIFGIQIFEYAMRNHLKKR